MTWYAAHAIMYVKFKDGNQDKYPIWENAILIEASSSDEAWEKAKIRAKEDEDDGENPRGESLWEGRPFIFVFAGIRKIVSCVDEENRPTDGTEIAYSQMELPDLDSLSKFLKEEEVFLRYDC
ncbi:DUF4288 domain-containing protein [Pseudanabaena sp. PCC 6802]|uniref:DUF4288 domain-containing protein n=1 Tax=Pseudanabaena sp. PCC 6802 TaxID=118173 RepID=UPI00036715C8|nr:DUF4288 domain-containing protein [Pseudanabaena sp. PCC 6802]